MAKNNIERKVNKQIRHFNKALKQDVFKDRFEIREIQKGFGVDGIEYFRYILIDHADSARNYETYWFSEYEIYKIFWEMNNFIVSSDFWKKYKEENYERYK